MEIQAKIFRAKADDQLQALLKDWIESEKTKISKHMAALATDPNAPDFVFRGFAGRLREIFVWEEELLRRKREADRLSNVLDVWKNKVKALFTGKE